MKEVKQMNGLEFAELLHEVAERLELEKQTCVEIVRPNFNFVYVSIVNFDETFSSEIQNDKGRYLTIPNIHISSTVKL